MIEHTLKGRHSVIWDGKKRDYASCSCGWTKWLSGPEEFAHDAHSQHAIESYRFVKRLRANTVIRADHKMDVGPSISQRNLAQVFCTCGWHKPISTYKRAESVFKGHVTSQKIGPSGKVIRNESKYLPAQTTSKGLVFSSYGKKAQRAPVTVLADELFGSRYVTSQTQNQLILT